MLRGPFAPDRELHERMRDRALGWWDRHVILDTPPDPDLATITDEEIRKRWPRNVGEAIEAEFADTVRWLLQDRAAAHGREVEAKARKARIDAELRVLTGDFAALTIDGQPVVAFAERDTGPKLDPALEWERPDVWAKYVTRGTSRAIRIVKGWEQA
jgi:plasmid stability protein